MEFFYQFFIILTGQKLCICITFYISQFYKIIPVKRDNYCVISFEDVYEFFLVEKGAKPDFETPIYADYINLFSGWKDADGDLYKKEEIVEKDIAYNISVIDLSDIFSASESELWKMDF